MPHATPQLDWELAAAITRRLLASAQEVHFSYARQNEAAEARPSRLIAQLCRSTRSRCLPELTAPAAEPPLTVSFEDSSRVPFAPGKVHGGAAVLTAQSQCPFKAFATSRLAAQSWNRPRPGLTASQRGNLLHAVLHAVWAGPPDGIRTQVELLSLTDRQAFVAAHVQRVFAHELPAHLRNPCPAATSNSKSFAWSGLVSEWLDYEATRVAFEVAETEAKRTVSVTGLTLDLRLDRIDRLSDDAQLVIDYKSGDVSPSAWELPRPDDVQLPLYAGFALDADERLGGLVFAKVRAGEMRFCRPCGRRRGNTLCGLKAPIRW